MKSKLWAHGWVTSAVNNRKDSQPRDSIDVHTESVHQFLHSVVDAVAACRPTRWQADVAYCKRLAHWVTIQAIHTTRAE